MKIVFLSNFFNHHQKPLSDELYSILGKDYVFIETSQMSEERKKLGYKTVTTDYLVKYDENKELCNQLIKEADVVLYGAAPHSLIKERIESGKVVLRCSERPLKKGIEPLRYLPRLIKWRKQFPNNKQVYLLCASAYTYADYKKFGMFKNRAFKWAYFTEVKQYENVLEVINNKEINSLLWCGRFLKLKHLDHAVKALNMLKKDGYDCKLTVIGGGKEEENIHKLIAKLGLEDMIEFKGVLPSTQVRQQMEKSEIFLFTSDRQEGWGAVLNEAMNSACAVVSSHAIGATPYLVKDGKNGLTYKSGDLENLYKKIKFLLDNKGDRQQIGENAYYTMLNEWSPKIAAQRIIELSKCIINKENLKGFENGPCSVAEGLSDSWYKG